LSRWQLLAWFGLLLGGVALFRPRLAFLLTLAWLPWMGHVRRWLYQFSSYESFDPILIVGPAMLAWLALITWLAHPQARREAVNTPASRFLAWLLVVFGLQIFNPLQGNLKVGLGGALYLITPLLAFFLGKSHLDRRGGRRLLWTWLGIGVIVMLFAHRQAYKGFTSYEQYWIEHGGYTALEIGGITRPLGTFVSGSEFSGFASAGAVMALAWLLWGRGRWRWILGTAVLASLLWATLLAGSATGVFQVIIPALILWSYRSARARQGAGLALAMVVLLGLFFSITRIQYPHGALQSIPVVGGMLDTMAIKVLDPLSERSTGRAHLNSPYVALMRTLQMPLGYGLGSTNMAAAKFGGRGLGTEFDIGDVFIATGFVGGILYLLVLYHLLKQTLWLCRRTRDPWHWAAFGMLISQIGGVLMNHYAVPVLYFALAGWAEREVWLERQRMAEERSQEEGELLQRTA